MELGASLNLPWFVDIGRIAYAALLGGLIGWERERRGREAGIRTFMAITLGACAFSLIGREIADGGRMSAAAVTGIGFIGAGLIVRDKSSITGLTTAATLWASAAVGASAAYGLYHLAAVTALLIFSMLNLYRLPGWKRLSPRARHSDTGAHAAQPSPSPHLRPPAVEAEPPEKTGSA